MSPDLPPEVRAALRELDRAESLAVEFAAIRGNEKRPRHPIKGSGAKVGAWSA